MSNNFRRVSRNEERQVRARSASENSNRPFPVRAKYAWNACVGVQLLPTWAGPALECEMIT